jgi:hypothetical protein
MSPAFLLAGSLFQSLEPDPDFIDNLSPFLCPRF